MKYKSEGYEKKQRIIREVIVIVIILIISTFLSVPSYLSEVKEYNRRIDDSRKNSSPEEQKMNVGILKSADK